VFLNISETIQLPLFGLVLSKAPLATQSYSLYVSYPAGDVEAIAAEPITFPTPCRFDVTFLFNAFRDIDFVIFMDGVHVPLRSLSKLFLRQKPVTHVQPRHVEPIFSRDPYGLWRS